MSSNSKRELGPDMVKSCEVVGIKVKNQKKESLGEIHEIVLDKVSGTVRYVVLSYGGFLGMGDKLFAMPWNSISYDTQEACFLANVELEKLKNAPSFDKDNWPNMSDRQLGEQIHNYYGQKPN